MEKSVVVEKKVSDKVGRPCKYDTHVEPYLDKIYEWLKQGYTDYSIAEQLGISQDSFTKYKERYTDLSELYVRARAERNNLVMNRMFAKACGEIAQVKQEKLTKDGKKVTLISEIYTPPDVNAADLYLRNNSEDYKSAKSEHGNLTLIQNNFQLPQIQAEIKQLEEELKKLESGFPVEVEGKVIE